MFEDKENELVCPNVYPMCQHMVPQNLCTKSGGGILQPCPTVSDLKYEFLRLSIDCVDFYLVESGTALCLQVAMFDISVDDPYYIMNDILDISSEIVQLQLIQ